MQDLMARQMRWTYPLPVTRILESNAPPIKFLSYTFTADIGLESGRETGPIFAMGGSLGGMGLYLKEGKPVFILRGLSGEELRAESTERLTRGDNKLALSVMYEGGMQMKVRPLVEKSIRITVSSNGREFLSEVLKFGMPGTFSSSETFDMGRDDGKALTDDYPAESPFPGTLRNLVFDFKPKAG
jgi:arylsulfatase